MQTLYRNLVLDLLTCLHGFDIIFEHDLLSNPKDLHHHHATGTHRIMEHVPYDMSRSP